ncbi:Zinc finger transcription factor ace1 [Tolypocladium ophioglossoides CBS 100239]|uniref:Zinc finger transcription factor ace1 n=1 Tax=Tolypocladium ophioglossoides (strain CBS 100239) TaxID=1163406 RepID=A0A0L0MX02_TOLOC|nr:Zinc finger transcription factor ace1 [Tolypocladium ophioglossoides CBS 100239]
MSFANPRRSPPAMTRPGSNNESGLSLKTGMALRKAATFHSPTSPVSQSADDAFAPPQLFRSQSHLNDVVDANLRRVAMTLDYVDETLSPKNKQCLSRKNSNNRSLRDTSFPIPRGFLDAPVVDPTTMATSEPGRRVLRPRSLVRSKQRGDADSGLGTSVASTNDKCVAAEKGTKSQASAPALTRSAAPSTKDLLPVLGQRAFNSITGRILGPLLAKSDLRDFHPIVQNIPYPMRTKKIICLRDVEKTLILMAPGMAKTAELYLSFCIESIHCIQATYELLSDREQTRHDDRPYTNGYFIDLTEQILAYGKQLRAGKTGAAENMDIDQSDEIKLLGGVAENGRPAELVRVKKDGTAISMATGKPVDMDGVAKIKRSLSEQRDNDEEIMRSMARRKKNASPEELAPKKCREPGCTKEFKRPCDLTKHEKTDSRPWKCPVPTCRYHDFGWPTEKEMDRHVNDKHSDVPAMFECGFPPCPYKSKRESNCKQHMEKAHGWRYVRTKTNGKKAPENASSSVQQTPPLGSMSTPSTTPSYSVPTPPQDRETIAHDFPRYVADADWLATYGLPPDTIDAMDLVLENPSPASAASHENYPPYQNGSTFLINPEEDIYAASVQGNAMLYTPNSLREVDEGFDESFGADGVDFELYPANLNKGNDYHPPFGEVPSANLGFSQTSQPDMFQQLDWSIPLGPYQPFQE